MLRRCVLVVMSAAVMLPTVVETRADIPSVLSDRIRQGSGIIDLLKDVTSSELTSYLQGGNVLLGVDLNEDAAGNESRDSVGVAIKQLQLLIQTTAGDFSFSEFYTNTTALISESGAPAAQTFYTLFGSLGSNEITGGTNGFDISQFDDVVEIRNVAFTGDILSARLNVTFLKTDGSGSNETFFDYSDGFEEFAILTAQDAALLDSADIGVASSTGSGITFTKQESIGDTAGAPEPLWLLVAVLPLMLLLWKRSHARSHK